MMMSTDARSTSRNADTRRHPLTRSPLHPLLFLLLAALAGCHGSSSSSHHTQEIQGHLVYATHLQVQVRVDNPGNITTLRTLPLDPNAKVTLGGQAVDPTKLPSNAKVTLTRDLDTHRIIEIEANQ